MADEARATLDHDGMGADLSPFLHPCPELATTEAASPYLRGGLASVAALPHLVADLSCLEGQEADCTVAARSAPTVGPCDTDAGRRSPLCASAARFAQVWADPDFRARRTAWGVQLDTNPRLPDDANGVRHTFAEPRDRAPGVHPTLTFAGSAGSWVVIDRDAQRKYTRQIRWPDGLMPTCKTLAELEDP